MNKKILLLFLIFGLVFILCIYKRKNKKVSKDPMIIKLKQTVSQLDPRIEQLEFFESNESYTEDKNKIYLCIRDEHGTYYDFNMLIYVTIHEITHALTSVIDIYHTTPEFRNTFETLLTKAHKMGFYNPEEPLYRHYCGIHLNVRNMLR